MLISIITINYNNLEGLIRTMTSVLQQTYPQIEYIVIDGGSSDGSKDYIENHQDNIAYWVSEQDKGIYHAMNKGISQATGEYILFLNSGDMLVSKDVIKECLPKCLNHEIICFDINVVGKDHSYIKSCPDTIRFSFLYTNTLPHQSTIIKRSLFESIGNYDETLKIVSDWKFFIIAICKYNVSYKYISRVLSIYYLGGISSNPDNFLLMNAERQKVLETEFSFLLNDMNELNSLISQVDNLRRSKKIKMLIRLGFLNKF
ncbi:glycosyltransferase family 2 protein [uncultured Gelidibacter sp.]|uniref:glycosyltransferase family 2 protein n=1 Tax=uncultured Gelidibacter sp. TaxID=259318 RepID=UPI002639E602|nr:glycosyltransferase family 2 protein [uncultured Gelidibacter sp.]